MFFLTLGFRNFWRQRRRNFFTVLSIMAGTAGLICLDGYINRWEYRGLYNSVYAYKFGTVSLYKKDGLQFAMARPKKYSFNQDEQEAILSLLGQKPEIEMVGRILSVNGLVGNGCSSLPFEVKAFELHLDEIWRNKEGVKRWSADVVDFKEGRPLSANSVGIARGLAKLLGKERVAHNTLPAKITDLNEFCKGSDSREMIARDPSVQLVAVTFDGQINALDADIAHYFSTGLAVTEDSKISAPLETIQELFQTKNVTSLSVFFHDHEEPEAKAAAIKSYLAAHGIEVDAYSWRDEALNPIFVGAMSFTYVMNAFFGFLISVIVVLSVANLTMMNIFERSREIGSLKALGFTQKDVMAIFASESFITAGLGIFLGLGTALIVSALVNGADIMFLPPVSSEPIPLILIPSVGVTTIIMILMFSVAYLAGLAASYLASRKSCFELLTHHSA